MRRMRISVMSGRLAGVGADGSRRPGSRRRSASARLAGGARAKLMFGLSRRRSQEVTVVEAPHHLAFAGPMGTSAARWGMEFEPADGGQTDAMMWIEVDLAGIMRAIRSVCSKTEFSASAISRWWRSRLLSVRCAGRRGVLDGAARLYRDAAELEEHIVTQTDRPQERLIETYRKKAKHYDITSRLYPAPGYPTSAATPPGRTCAPPSPG